MTERPFYLLIQDETTRRANLTDEELLMDLTLLPPLPDEDLWTGMNSIANPVWSEKDTQQQLVTFLAMANLIAERKLRTGVRLLLEKASYGDMGETMRGLCHSFENAFDPDWKGLADVCIQAALHHRSGTRLWAINQLGALRDSRALPVLINAIYDDAYLVRKETISSLGMILRVQENLPQGTKQQLMRIVTNLQQMYRDLELLLDHISDTPEYEE